MVADRLGLQGGVDLRATLLGNRDHLHRYARLYRRLQRDFRHGVAQSHPRTSHVRCVRRHFVLQKLPPAELLPVGAIHAARHHRLVDKVVMILQIMQRYPQPRLDTGRPGLPIKRPHPCA